MVTTSTKNKLTQTLATGAAALSVALVAGVGSANAGTIKLTPTQMQMVGLQQTDFTTGVGAVPPLTFNTFNPATDVVLGPGETFGSFNSVHLDFKAEGVSGPGSVFCQVPGGNGLCTGTVDSSLSVTLTIPGTANKVINVPLLAVTPYSLTQNQVFTVPQVMNMNTLSMIWDKKAGTGGTAAEIQAVLDAFDAPPGTVNVVAFADGMFNVNEVTGSSLFGNPIRAKVTANLFYDYHVEAIPVTTDVPEPSAVLGLGLLSLGAFFKRNKQQDSDKG